MPRREQTAMRLRHTGRLTRDEVYAALLERPATARELAERLRPMIGNLQPVAARAGRLCRELRQRGLARPLQVLAPRGTVRWTATPPPRRNFWKQAMAKGALRALARAVVEADVMSWPVPAGRVK